MNFKLKLAFDEEDTIFLIEVTKILIHIAVGRGKTDIIPSCGRWVPAKMLKNIIKGSSDPHLQVRFVGSNVPIKG